MRKTVAILTFFLFSVIAVMLPEVVSAQGRVNIVVNQTAENVFVVYSTWLGASDNLPGGYRTRGYARVRPGESREFKAWKDNPVYFRIWQGGEAIKPAAATETFRFWVHPSKGFVVVSPRMDGSVLRDELTHTNPASSTLRREDGFIRYANGSEVKVDSSWVSVSEEGETDPDEGLSLDVNGDGVINASDVAVVASRLGQGGTGNAADVNGDGTVTVDDIKLVSDAIGTDVGAPPPTVTQPPMTQRPSSTEDMVLIPAGEFEMGSNAGDLREKPVHTVYVDAFYMDKYEVTNAEYKKFVDANPEWQKSRIPRSLHNGNYLKHWDNSNNYPAGKADHPVISVSWYGAMAYAAWAGKRLPTEAEWEKAARGGLSGQVYPWGNTIDPSRTNYNKPWSGKIGTVPTMPVGSYTANGYGLYDIGGNVSEWCLDEYDAAFYSRSPKRNPVSGADSVQQILDNYTEIESDRVARGGSWLSFAPMDIRIANRWMELSPSVALSDVGFRCVSPVSPGTPLNGTQQPVTQPTVPQPPSSTEGMVLIPAGEFEMGSSDGAANEKPVHTVYVDAFYMDKYEVTNAQYAVFLNTVGKHKEDDYAVEGDKAWGKHWVLLEDWGTQILFVDGRYRVVAGHENHPVYSVTWYGAMAYALWAGKRLPTEAEWEKAARGGLSDSAYPWGDTIDSSRANYGKPETELLPVGSYAANGYGLFDMAGNVLEWCLDEYNPGFYSISPARNPLAGANSVQWLLDNYIEVESIRVLRGGGSNYTAYGVRVATRYDFGAGSTIQGFRCVKSVSP